MRENIQKYNLTIPQENIWLVERLNPNTNINNIFGVFRIKKKLDVKILNEALNNIIRSNDALRIKIIEEDVPKQYVSEYEYEIFNTCIFNDSTNIEIDKIIKKIAKERINILNNKLYDIQILQNNNETCVCVKTHHIISDAWTLGQIAEQIKENYIKVRNKEKIEIKPSYINYIKKDEQYRESEKYLLDKEFWNDYVKELKCENKYEVVKNKESKRVQKEINKELYKKICDFCTKYKLSEYSFFLGVISIYFSRIFNQENIVVGTPFLNRKKIDKELEIMGMFIATLPISINTKNHINFIEVCKNINTTNLQCFRHSKYPYKDIQKAYQEFTKENINLYEIAFSYQINKLEVELDGDTGTTSWFPNNVQTNPLLISFVNHFGEHILYYDYLTNCFNISEIDEINERIINIIEQILDKEQIELKDISILSKKDKNLISKFNNTGKIINNNETIISRFEKIVCENKNKIAVKCGNSKVTYNELNIKANNLCKKIQREGIYNKGIAIVLDNNIDFIISILGVLKSGNYYIPILPEESKERMEYIIKDSDVKILISNKKYIDSILVENLSKINIENINLNEKEIENVNILPNDISYIIYTSGTTGNPKGVMMKHENIISLINSINMDKDLKYVENDIAISLLKHSFDASAIDIYSSILNGGKLILLPKKEEFNAKKVVEIMVEENVTRVFTVHKWIEQIQKISIENDIELKKLRIIGTGAEVLEPKKFESLLLKNPSINIYNTYGPTEATMFMTKHKITNKDIINNTSPIGKLIPTTRATIIDKNNNILPINCKGELVIYEDKDSSRNIAKGYFNKNKLTKEKFVIINNSINNEDIFCYKTGDIAKINEDLELEFIGREDDFVKLAGGYLISINEVEQKVKRLVGSNIEITIIASKIKKNNNLILFFSKNEKSINIKNEEIKNIIDENITFYMKPKHIIEVEQIPRNKNGKVDRKKLEQIAKRFLKEKNINVKPQTTLEQMIYDKVKRIVEEDFSITDDFEEDLGLDSLNMTYLYVELANSKMTIQDLYNYSTVKDLADMMKSEIINKEDKKQTNIKVANNSKKFDLSTVLLTGVTGFVGVNLLKELVENEETKKIYCIVREKIELSSQVRFEETIKNYFSEEMCNKIKNKTVVLNGDITKEDLGVLTEELKQLKKEVKTIVNCAANVKHIGKYSNFYRDNVKSVMNLLDICKENNISLAHISTLSLHGFQNENTTNVFDENILNINQTFDKSPYLISKYEAEQKILKFINKYGINAKIFRIGNIMPRIYDGVFQKNFEQNAFMLAIKEISNIGLKTVQLINSNFYLTPADECTKAINVILKSDINNTIYHIESDKAIKIDEIVKIIMKKNNELKIVSTEELKEKLYENYNVGVEHLKAIINQNTNPYSKDITINTLEALGFKWAVANEQYLNNIVNIAFKIKRGEKNDEYNRS